MLQHEMSPTCRAAIVIPCLNESKLVVESLESVIAASGRLATSDAVEILYVDNGSEDDTAELIQERSDEYPGVGMVHQPRRGIAHARRLGATSVLSRAAKRQFADHEDFWIISSDADVVVPENWLVDWFENFDTSLSLLISGSHKFPPAFNANYPNIARVLAEVRGRRKLAINLMGPINPEGANSAIERKAYAAIGPFEQPYRVTSEGNIENLANEDWDIGTRARYFGMSIGMNISTPVITSARRIEHNTQEFLNGTAYQKEFLKAAALPKQTDIALSQVSDVTTAIVYRQSQHYISKVILVDNRLLEKPDVIEFLGQDVSAEMKTWIAKTPRPDLLNDRNSFLLEYLVAFHEEFGEEVSNSLLVMDRGVRDSTSIASAEAW